MSRYRNFIFRISNYKELVAFDEDKMLYLIYQEEICPTTGTPHLQGYCELVKQTSMAPVKVLMGGEAHLEARRGTQKEAIDYCKKDDTRKPDTSPYEFGTPKEQGKRKDLILFRDNVIAGKRERDMILDDETIGMLARYPRLYSKIANMTRPEREHQLKVVLLIGDTGTGKTRYVMDKYRGEDLFYKMPISNGTMWFDDYDKHEYVLMDDFAGKASCMSLVTLLQLLDYEASRVPVKGSHVWWMPQHIWITTNIHPKDWYNYENREKQYLALKRRFSKVVLFSNDHVPRVAPDSWWGVYTPLVQAEPQHL